MTIITATAVKPDPSAIVGVSINNELRITNINPEGLFANSDLKEGMLIKSINNTSVEGTDAKFATSLIKTSLEAVTIAADDAAPPSKNGGGVAVTAVAVPEKDVVTVPNSSHAGPSPPKGAPVGGIWGTQKYSGGTTGALICAGCLCFGLPGLLLACCGPYDERDAYRVNNRVYDAAGNPVGPADANFVPKASHMRR